MSLGYCSYNNTISLNSMQLLYFLICFDWNYKKEIRNKVVSEVWDLVYNKVRREIYNDEIVGEVKWEIIREIKDIVNEEIRETYE